MKKQKKLKAEDRIYLRATPELVARVRRQATMRGLSISAYVTMGITVQVLLHERELEQIGNGKSQRP